MIYGSVQQELNRQNALLTKQNQSVNQQHQKKQHTKPGKPQKQNFVGKITTYPNQANEPNLKFLRKNQSSSPVQKKRAFRGASLQNLSKTATNTFIRNLIGSKARGAVSHQSIKQDQKKMKGKDFPFFNKQFSGKNLKKLYNRKPISVRVTGTYPLINNPRRLQKYLAEEGIEIQRLQKNGPKTAEIFFRNEKEKSIFERKLKALFNCQLRVQDQQSKAVIQPKNQFNIINANKQLSFSKQQQLNQSLNQQYNQQQMVNSNMVWINPKLRQNQQNKKSLGKPNLKELSTSNIKKFNRIYQYQDFQDYDDDGDEFYQQQQQYENLSQNNQVSRRSNMRSFTEEQQDYQVLQQSTKKKNKDFSKGMKFQAITEDAQQQNQSSQIEKAQSQKNIKKKSKVKMSTLMKLKKKFQAEKIAKLQVQPQNQASQAFQSKLQKFSFIYQNIPQIKASPIRITNNLRNLSLKSNPKALCLKMCSAEQAKSRKQTHDLSIFEKEKNDSSDVNLQLAVKKYGRSAADKIMNDPQSIRPPQVLQLTVNYLLNVILDADHQQHLQFYIKPQCQFHSLEDIIIFVTDRLRSVQQDFKILSQDHGQLDNQLQSQQQLQNQSLRQFISSHEKSTKMQLIFSNEGLQLSNQEFDPFRNYKQLVATLSALRQHYLKIYNSQQNFYQYLENEAQFISYLIILQMNQPSAIHNILFSLSQQCLQTNEIQYALEIYTAYNTKNPLRYLQLLD